ncbi:MAG: cell division protein FtsQ/DivIB [Bacteroidia bacterium]|nr:cell division protein FtsQ/DivIB [Bacteroidia bacterium]
MHNRRRNRLQWVVTLAGCTTLCVFLGLAARTSSALPCTGVVIELKNEADNFFLDVPAVRELVQLDSSRVGMPLATIDLSAIEATLLATRYVARAVASVDAQQRVRLEVTLRRPMVRVVSPSGSSCYVDAEGVVIPLSGTFTARCPIVRGAIAQPDTATTVTDSTLHSLLPLLRYIDAERFWRAQVSEVYVNRYGEVTLYPEVGDMAIELGTADGFRQKLTTALAFYDQVAATHGYANYRSISLAYKGQVVARKRTPDTD